MNKKTDHKDIKERIFEMENIENMAFFRQYIYFLYVMIDKFIQLYKKTVNNNKRVKAFLTYFYK